MIEKKNTNVAAHLDEITDIMHNAQVYYLRAAETLIHDYMRAHGITPTPAELSLSIELLQKIDDDFDYLIAAVNEDRRILAGEIQ